MLDRSHYIYYAYISEEYRPILGTLRPRRNDNINMDRKKWARNLWTGWSGSTYRKGPNFRKHGHEISCWKKCGKFWTS